MACTVPDINKQPGNEKEKILRYFAGNIKSFRIVKIIFVCKGL